MVRRGPRSSFWQKQFPTLLGVGILVLALVAGVFFIGQGPGVFAPRAAPETTPQKVQLTNVTDNSFTVSFFTQEQTAGFVKYGTEPDNLRSQASDDRDQLSGTVGSFTLHHVTVRGLSPNTTYYYVLGTGTRSTFDNNGSPFSVKTAQRGGAPSAAQTAYGNVLDQSGQPAEGAIVYASIAGVGPMSSLVKSSGSWAIPLANARTADGSSYATINESDAMSILVQGEQANTTSELAVTVAQSQPVENITLGTNGTTAPAVADSTRGSSTSGSGSSLTDTITSGSGGSLEDTEGVSGTGGTTTTTTSRTSGGLGSLTDEQDTALPGGTTTEGVITTTTVDVDSTEIQRVVEPPKIVGTAAPNVEVTIEVNSETQIVQTVTSDATGQFELDLASIAEAQDLEAGEHMVTASYTDPDTGLTVTKQQTFTLDEDGIVLAQSSSETTTTSPYSSGNPFTIEDSTGSGGLSSPSPSPSVSPSPSPASTRSGQVATTSGLPKSGSVGTTMALVLGGLFFILSGVWSYWISQQLEESYVDENQTYSSHLKTDSL